MAYAIRLKNIDDYIRNLNEYVIDNRSDVKTFSSIHEAEMFAVQNNIDEEDYIIENYTE